LVYTCDGAFKHSNFAIFSIFASINNLSLLMNTVYITHNGCQMRSLDASKVAAYFLANGIELKDNPANADLSVLISCSGIDSQVRNTLDTIDYLLKASKDNLVILGCMPATMPEKISSLFNGVTIPLKEMNRIDDLFPDFKYKYDSIDEPYNLYGNRYDTDHVDFSRGVCVPVDHKKSRFNLNRFNKKVKTASIRICNGCNSACSYCNIKIAVGKLKSLSMESIIKTYSSAINNGLNHVVFMGDDTGAYGTDMNFSLPELLQELRKYDNGKKILWSFDEINPQWALKYKDYFLQIAKERKMLIFACPIQNGSQRIIDLMNRHYKIKEVIEFFKELKKSHRKIEIHTHLILGFPSETDKDFTETCNLFSANLINHALLASYSDFDYTRSQKFDNKINKETRKERIYTLQKILKEKNFTFLSNMD